MVLDMRATAPPTAGFARPAFARRPGDDPEPNATLVEREDLTPTVVRLRVRPDGGTPSFRSGQYFAMGLPVDGRFVQRPYSAASAPRAADALEFLVRLVPGGSLTPNLWRLRRGDRLRVGPPKGLFTLDEGDPRQHVLLATGTGIAPLRSMLASLMRRPDAASAPRPVVVHGVATWPELAYRDQLARLDRGGAIVYAPAMSRPADPVNGGWHGLTGRLDALVGRVIAEARVDPASTVAYLCGNPAMIAAVEPRLVAIGIAPDAVRAERYWNTTS